MKLIKWRFEKKDFNANGEKSWGRFQNKILSSDNEKNIIKLAGAVEKNLAVTMKKQFSKFVGAISLQILSSDNCPH